MNDDDEAKQLLPNKPPDNAQQIYNYITEPALYLTTQTTLPQLTALLFALSIALIAVSINIDWNAEPLPLISLGNTEAALFLFSLSAMLFVFSMSACVKSHAWDYFSLSEERREYLGIGRDKKYISNCQERRNYWHSRAVRSYFCGFIFLLIGIILLFWFTSRLTSGTILFGLLLYILIGILDKYKFQKFD